MVATPRSLQASSDLDERIDSDIGSPEDRKSVRSRLSFDTSFAEDIQPLRCTALDSMCPAIRSVCLLAVDVLLGLFSFYAAYWLADALRLSLLDVTQPVERMQGLFATTIVGAVPILLIVGLSGLWGHYNRRFTFWTEMRDIGKAVVYSVALLSLLFFAAKIDFSRFWVVSFCFWMICLLPLGRTSVRLILRRAGLWEKPVVVIGDGKVALQHAREACSDRYLGLHVTSYVDIEDKTRLADLACRLRHGNGVSEESFGSERERPHVVVAVEDLDSLSRSKTAFDNVMANCAAMTFIPPLSGIPLYNSQLIQVFRGDVAVLRLHNNLKRRAAKLLKRAMDVAFGSMALIVALPLMLVIALLIKLDGGPMMFGQERIGQGGRKFTCLKFRSMDINAAEKLRHLLETDSEARESWERDHKLKNDPRITRIGRFIRKTSLDELPQFWNVLKGEMSLIGPRPIVQAEIVRYANDFSYYSEAKPGITGLWQISGRNNTTYEERVSLDVWYVRNWSPWLDAVIALKTVPILVFGIGAY